MIKSTYNQMANTKNSYQGSAKKVLCVCSAGLLRSPTAANVLAAEFGYNTRAAGCTEEYALIPVSEALLYWADEVVFMEEHHKEAILREYPELMKTVTAYVLNVPDMYPWGNENLKDIIVKAYLDLDKDDATTE